MSVQERVDSTEESPTEKDDGHPSDRDSPGSTEPNILRRRLRHAQQNIQFLQDQHKCTLSDLHSELERLKVQNREQQWRLVLAGQYGTLPDPEFLQKFTNLSTQTENNPDPNELMHIKRLEEDNADLQHEVAYLRAANEKFKSEILNQQKKMEISPRSQTDARRLIKPSYRSKYSPRSAQVSNLRVISRPGASGSQLLPAIPGALDSMDADGRAKTISLPALRGVNQNIKHQRRLDAINYRKLN